MAADDDLARPPALRATARLRALETESSQRLERGTLPSLPHGADDAMVALATLNQELVNAKLRCAESEADRAQLRREFKRMQSAMEKLHTAELEEVAVEAAAPSRPSSRPSSPITAAAAAAAAAALTTEAPASIEPGAPQHGARHSALPHEAEPSFSAVSSAGAPPSAVSSAPPTPMAAAQRLMATLAKSEARGRPSSSNLMIADDL
jgi:hypothetical protein